MSKNIKKEISPERAAILKKIEQYEREGRFDEDVENDPESPELRPEDIKYLDRSLWAEIKNKTAFASAYAFLWMAQLKKNIILKDTVGVENLAAVKDGAIITCNHFNPLDSFVMQRVFDRSRHKGRMYRIIREGNYTGFPGYFGFLMRNCNTMPLSSNMATMKHFLRAVKAALADGNCILIYPEQSMWWNYRKPKPLKPGAFDMAVKNGVPVVPVFITLEDSDIVGDDGLPVQIYTPHVGKAIYPDPALGKKEARDKMMGENYEYFKQVYEDFYGIPLTYTTERPE